MRAGRLIAGIILVPLALFIVVSTILVFVLRAPIPTGGVAGAEADALAHHLEEVVNRAAWERTGALMWSARGGRDHLWDKSRGLIKVRLGDTEALLDIGRQHGRAWQEGRELDGELRTAALARAYAAWVNDSFWLNPLVKLFDPGVKREIVAVPSGDPGTRALLISYTSGGLTPGDQYLWLIPEEGPPVAWRMWTSIFPIQGILVTWEGWIRFDTGALVSTQHHIPGLDFELSNVRGAATLAELTGGEDPFAPLFGPK